MNIKYKEIMNMHVKKVILEDHLILGNIEFDFCDSNGIPFDTILIAGENGAGKSTFLNMLFEFFKQPIRYTPSVGISKYQLLLTKKEIKYLVEGSNIFREAYDEDFPNDIDIEVDNSMTHDYEAFKINIYNKDGEKIFLSGRLMGEGLNTLLKCIFSDVEVNYTPASITSTSSLNTDNEVEESIKSTSNIATDIKQLLIDIESLDSGEFVQWSRANPDKKNNEGIDDKRMRRFKNAFDFMFPSKKFKRIDNVNGEKQVIFEEYCKEISINDLSSGEKQIIFRGSFLLKDKLSTEGAIILIDEPEISLHPNWQIKIIEFYKNLFLNEEFKQTSQLFIVTHSPFVLHNKNRLNDKIVVLEKNENEIYIKNNPKYYNWTREEVINQAFDIKLDFAENKFIVFVEGTTDKEYIEVALKVFGVQIENLLIEFIGRIEDGNQKFSGDSALNQAKEYLLSNAKLNSNNKYLLIYDSDTKARDLDIIENQLYVRKSPFNKRNNRFRKGVENLLNIPQNFDFSEYYISRETIDDYGAKKFTQTLDKTKLCNYICNEADETEQKIWLEEFKGTIIKSILEVAPSK